jgi:hypothetical protein
LASAPRRLARLDLEAAGITFELAPLHLGPGHRTIAVVDAPNVEAVTKLVFDSGLSQWNTVEVCPVTPKLVAARVLGPGTPRGAPPDDERPAIPDRSSYQAGRPFLRMVGLTRGGRTKGSHGFERGLVKSTLLATGFALKLTAQAWGSAPSHQSTA